MQKSVLSLVSAVAAANLKVGVTSDPHYNAYYSPTSSANHCLSTTEANDVYAPVGRYECDTTPAMFDLLMSRFKAQFGEVDFLLVPGDHVAHNVSAKDTDADSSHYAAVKKNLSATWDMFKHYFPNTLILPTIGNNDARFHDQAIDESDKADYYKFIYELWFKNFDGNQDLNLNQIQSTLNQAGHYRADVNGRLSVLQLNSMYMAYDDQSAHGGEQKIQLDWLE